jgi:DNA-binding response OmpR family regulator
VSDDVFVSLDTNSITVRGVSLRLAPKHAEILHVLAGCMPAPVRRGFITARVWGLCERERTAKNLDVHIFNLRRKLEPLGLTIRAHIDNGSTGGFALVDLNRQRAVA